MPRLILASSSPRRREILASAGYAFTVIPSPYEEDMSHDLPADELAIKLSAHKAEEVSHMHPEAIVLAADTFIVLEGGIMGKPRDEADAWRMLRALSGREHIVVTGFTVEHKSAGRIVSRAVASRVRFRELSEDEIADYIATGEPLDKAGAYGIQERGAALVESIEGDYLNIVGLPMEEVKAVLEGFGKRPFY